MKRAPRQRITGWRHADDWSDVPLPRSATVRFEHGRMTEKGRYVKLYIATPMHRSQLCVVRA